MAIVSRISVEQAQSAKETVKKSLTQHLKGAVSNDASSSTSSNSSESDHGLGEADNVFRSGGGSKNSQRVEKTKLKNVRSSSRNAEARGEDLASGDINNVTEPNQPTEEQDETGKADSKSHTITSFLHGSSREQSISADAVLTAEGADKHPQTQGIDPAIMPLGIITLEDILEELIGEEIYDEFDPEGSGIESQGFVPPGAPDNLKEKHPEQLSPRLDNTKRLVAASLVGAGKIAMAPAMGQVPVKDLETEVSDN